MIFYLLHAHSKPKPHHSGQIPKVMSLVIFGSASNARRWKFNVEECKANRTYRKAIKSNTGNNKLRLGSHFPCRSLIRISLSQQHFFLLNWNVLSRKLIRALSSKPVRNEAVYDSKRFWKCWLIVFLLSPSFACRLWAKSNDTLIGSTKVGSDRLTFVFHLRSISCSYFSELMISPLSSNYCSVSLEIKEKRLDFCGTSLFCNRM